MDVHTSEHFLMVKKHHVLVFVTTAVNIHFDNSNGKTLHSSDTSSTIAFDKLLANLLPPECCFFLAWQWEISVIALAFFDAIIAACIEPTGHPLLFFVRQMFPSKETVLWMTKCQIGHQPLQQMSCGWKHQQMPMSMLFFPWHLFQMVEPNFCPVCLHTQQWACHRPCLEHLSLVECNCHHVVKPVPLQFNGWCCTFALFWSTSLLPCCSAIHLHMICHHCMHWACFLFKTMLNKWMPAQPNCLNRNNDNTCIAKMLAWNSNMWCECAIFVCHQGRKFKTNRQCIENSNLQNVKEESLASQSSWNMTDESNFHWQTSCLSLDTELKSY